MVELDLKALDCVRHIIKRNVEKGLLKNFALGIVDFEHLYNTIGFIGIYETMKSFGYVRQDEFGNTFYTPEAEKEFANLERIGFGKVPVCMAKTQYSLTDDQTKLGRPTGFRITVRQVTISAGAGFVVALTGEIMKMPGLPKRPAAERIDVDENGVISGLF